MQSSDMIDYKNHYTFTNPVIGRSDYYVIYKGCSVFGSIFTKSTSNNQSNDIEYICE